jgi:hypothetical protein
MKKLLFSTLCLGSVFGSVNYDLIVDPYFSPYMGADDLLFAQYELENLEKWAFHSNSPPQENWSSRWGRFATQVLFWDPLGYTLAVTQHEVFGHGYRIRSLGHSVAYVTGYKIGRPPPYGFGGGATQGQVNTEKMTAFEGLAVDSAGMEASAILATRVKMQWLQRGSLDPKQTTLYLYSQQDILNYVSCTQDGYYDGGDISNYVHLLNQLYPQDKLTVSSLKKQTLINLLDPYTYYALLSWWEYIFHGTEGVMPMISLGSYRYLPGARLGLTPFGPEYYLDNFFVKDQYPFHVYLRGGHHAGHTYAGIGMEHAYLWNTDSYSAGIRLDVWVQPYTDFDNPRYSLAALAINHGLPSVPNDPTLGISGSFILRKKLWKTGGLYAELGGKTAGFVPGESLEASAIARLGITLWEG